MSNDRSAKLNDHAPWLWYVAGAGNVGFISALFPATVVTVPLVVLIFAFCMWQAIACDTKYYLSAPRAIKKIKNKKKAALTQGESDSKTSNSKELAKHSDPEPVYDSYGHPTPPILILRASVPSPPIGYGWEILVNKGDNGNPHIRLSMISLSSGEEMESIEADLIIMRKWKYAKDETYSKFYRQCDMQVYNTYRGHKVRGFDQLILSTYASYEDALEEQNKQNNALAGKIMMNNLVSPMVSWAQEVVLRYIVDNPDPTKTNYVLVASTGN